MPRLLAEYRGVRNPAQAARLTMRTILRWADAHFARTGRWPKRTSGPIADAPGETWMAVNSSLCDCGRGLRRRTTLAALLAKHRGVRNGLPFPRLTVRRITGWAKAHRERYGQWPNHRAGRILGAEGETWSGVELALQRGTRGLPGGESLFYFLFRHGCASNVNGRGTICGRAALGTKS